MSKLRMISMAVFTLLATATPVLAHHSFTAEFDGSKLIAVTGTLSRVEWENPHMWFYVDAKDENGNTVNWAFEAASPNHLRNQDPQSRQKFMSNIGKAITVTACPAKNVPHRASTSSVKFTDGKVMKLGGENYSGDVNEQQLLQNAK